MNNTLTTKQGRGGAIVKQGTIKNYDALVVDYLIHLDSFPDSAREAELVLKSSGLISRWSDKTLRLYERAVKERNL